MRVYVDFFIFFVQMFENAGHTIYWVSNPGMSTLQVLDFDFDFEKLCSVSLSN